MTVGGVLRTGLESVLSLEASRSSLTSVLAEVSRFTVSAITTAGDESGVGDSLGAPVVGIGIVVG